MNSIKAWLQASRLASQSYIFFPLLLGQCCYYRAAGMLDPVLLLLAHLYGLFIQLYIVYANDYADQETDRLNTTFNMFSGGSRVLVEGRLTRAQLRTGTGLVVLLNVLVGCMLSFACGRPLALLFVAVSLGLLWLYSFSPARFSYRGGGELLQMFGVGVVLPVFGYYVQAGSVEGFPGSFLLFILPAQLACAMATALPDYPSDRQSRKRTFAVLLGPGRAKAAIIFLNSMSILFYLMVFPREGSFAGYGTLPSLLCTVLLLVLLPSSEPGTKRLNLFVTCSVASTVCLMAASALLLVYAWRAL